MNYELQPKFIHFFFSRFFFFFFLFGILYYVSDFFFLNLFIYYIIFSVGLVGYNKVTLFGFSVNKI